MTYATLQKEARNLEARAAHIRAQAEDAHKVEAKKDITAWLDLEK